MRRIHITLLAAALAALLATGSPALHAQDGKPAVFAPAPEALRPAEAEAEAWGRRIYLHDRAAWLVTDALFDTRKGKALMPRLGGWVTEEVDGGVRVIFVSNDATPVRVYEQVMRNDERLDDGVFESAEPLTAEHLAQLRARETAGSQSFKPACAERYNAVSLKDGDGWRVYLMPGFSKVGVIPTGGYHRFDIDPSGRQVGAQRAFSRGCLDIEDDGGDSERGRPVMTMVTHSLDPTPTEVHVFTSFHLKLPTAVMTSVEGGKPMTWIVQRGKIEFNGEPATSPRRN